MKFFTVGWLETPLGPLVAVGDQDALHLLEFVERHDLEEKIEHLKSQFRVAIVLERTEIIDSIEEELKSYFRGELKQFLTPFVVAGTPFQKNVWSELQHIPFGETRSYSDIAKTIENPRAMRAVGSANGANQIAIVIPCHRVINSNGQLGGYGGGLFRKKWLLEHEVKYGK